jgi:membrane associated rhomboid family serine protease
MESGTIETREEELLPIPPDLGRGRGEGALPLPRANLWALVLEARGIPCTVEKGDAGWLVHVPSGHFRAALDELRQFEEENRNWPPLPPASHPLAENTLSTLSILLLLATFHNLTLLHFTHPWHNPADWIALGSADSARILNGQWWRLATALTLHSGWLHLLGNLTIGGVFIVFVCRDLGSGLAWFLLLGTGVCGNLANALLQGPSHTSIGASTMVFGAVGILASLSLLRNHRYLRGRWALPLGAAASLLAMLGTEGEHTDLGAHLFGFLFGVIFGLIAESLIARFGRPRPLLNALLAVLSALVVVSAWWAALSFGT